MVHLHRAIQPAGLVEGAKCFSIFKTDDAYQILFTGNAAREMKEARIRGVLMELLAKFIFDKIEASFTKKIAAAEEKIDETKLEEYMSDKKNQKVLFSNIQDISIEANKFQYPEVTMLLKDGAKRMFVFRKASMDEVKTFFGK